MPLLKLPAFTQNKKKTAKVIGALAGIGAVGATTAYWLNEMRVLGHYPSIFKYLFLKNRDAIFVMTEQKAHKVMSVGSVRGEIYRVLDSALAESGWVAPEGHVNPDVPPNPGFAERIRALRWVMSRLNSVLAEDITRKIRGRPSVYDVPPTEFLGSRWYYRISPKRGPGTPGTTLHGV